MNAGGHRYQLLNDLEEVYSRYIMGKAELKSKIGQFTSIWDWCLRVVYIAEFVKDEIGFNAVHTKSYDLSTEMDQFVSDLFDLSLTHNIMNIDPKKGKIYVARSKNGKTNISREIMDFILKKLKPEIRDAELSQICTRD